jgi:hypothetical protein
VDYQGESYSNLMISHKRLLQKQQLRDFTEWERLILQTDKQQSQL